MAPLALPPHLEQRLFADSGAAAGGLAAAVAGSIEAGLARRGAASLVVSGGRSPAAFLRALGAHELDWGNVFVSLADERWVDPRSADSNEALVRENLLRGPASGANFVALMGEQASPRAGLCEAQARVAAMPRPFDAVVLGMGEDGHTASLFPGAEGLAAALEPEGADLLAAIDPPLAHHARITMTVAALLSSRQVYLLLSGARKRRVLEQAAIDADTAVHPVAAVLGQRRSPVAIYWSESDE